MKFLIVCVRDSKADVYGVPFFMASKGHAIRSFSDEVNREAADNIYYRHPEDFELFELGAFDDAQADFEILPKPVSLCHGGAVSIRKNSN